MLEQKTVLVVVPARGGSVGIKLKNLREVAGLSLVAIAGRVVAQLGFVDRAVVSTDDDRIAAAAEAAGIGAPFRRPEDLSGNRIADWDVLHQALIEMEQQDARRYDIVVMLQPTSPLRTPEQVEACVKMLIEGEFDAVWSVSETDTKGHPLKQLLVQDSGEMSYYDPEGAKIIARQQLTPVYHRNGVAYAITRECILDQKNIKGERCGAYVIEGPMANIDTEDDLERAELLAARLDLPWLK
ncbi:MAG: CMP-N,N'-diacetyllegionaminic acid synthase [Verrucomicrobiales bacterium]|jgi:CMP-N,N'-diacetyllegionaminic acid synthase